MTEPAWRPTQFNDDPPEADDWCLWWKDPRLPLARAYRVDGGPQDSHWKWSVLTTGERGVADDLDAARAAVRKVLSPRAPDYAAGDVRTNLRSPTSG